jgi:hypothetical protein
MVEPVSARAWSMSVKLSIRLADRETRGPGEPLWELRWATENAGLSRWLQLVPTDTIQLSSPHHFSPPLSSRLSQTHQRIARVHTPQRKRKTQAKLNQITSLTDPDRGSSYFRGIRVLARNRHAQKLPSLVPGAQTLGFQPEQRRGEDLSRASYRTFKQAVIHRDHSEVHSKHQRAVPR